MTGIVTDGVTVDRRGLWEKKDLGIFFYIFSFGWSSLMGPRRSGTALLCKRHRPVALVPSALQPRI